MSSNVKKSLVITSTALFYFILAGFALIQILPFWFKIVEALQPSNYNPLTNEIYWLPIKATFSNFGKAWGDAKLGQGYINSLIVAVSYIILSSFAAVLCGYVLSKLNFRGKRFIFMLLLSTMMVPGEIMMISNYELINTYLYFMLDSRLALIIPGILNIFGVFLVKQFLEGVPDSIFESARIDGARQPHILWFIVFPLVLPAVSTYIILTFISVWNDYLWPYIILIDPAKYTVQLKLMVFTPSNGSNTLAEDQIMRAAGMLLVVFPVIFVYALFQKQFVDGIALTGLK